jgi:hypothetical protein
VDILSRANSSEPFIGNITIECSNLAGITAFSPGVFSGYKLTAKGCNGNGTEAGGINTNYLSTCLLCEVTGGQSATAMTYGVCIGCEVTRTGSTSTSIAIKSASGGGQTYIAYSAVVANTGHGITSTIAHSTVVHNDVIENGGDGFHDAARGTPGDVIVDNIFEHNTGYSIYTPEETGIFFANNGIYGNGTDKPDFGTNDTFYFTPVIEFSPQYIAYTSTCCTSPSGATPNLTLTTTSTGGAMLAKTGYVGTLPDGNVGYESVGLIPSSARFHECGLSRHHPCRLPPDNVGGSITGSRQH